MKIYLFIYFFIFANQLLKAKSFDIKTSDNCHISVNQKIISTDTIVLLEVHGLGSTKEEWNKFNKFLEKEKINWLAIDLRGHGNSKKCDGKELNYTNFFFTDWQNIDKEIDAAYKHLLKENTPEKIILIGASLGANAIFAYAKNIKVKKLILLSPGLNYAGFKPEEYFSKVNSEILIVSSLTDKYSYYSSQIFKNLCNKHQKKCDFLYLESGHGVQIFDTTNGESYATKIINWIKKR